MIDKDSIPRALITHKGIVCVVAIVSLKSLSVIFVQVFISMVEVNIVRCPLDVHDFPFDTQTCKLHYQSQCRNTLVRPVIPVCLLADVNRIS